MMARAWVVAVAAALLTWQGPAAAEELDKRALAAEVLTLGDFEATFMRMVEDNRSTMILAMTQSGAYTAEEANRIWEFYLEEVRAGLGAVRERMTAEYAANFTAEELASIRDFFQSPGGRALTREQLNITRAGGQAGVLLGVAAGMRAEQRFLDEKNGRRGPA